MKFYHGTSFEAWEKIQKEGILWGVRIIEGWKSIEHINEYFDSATYERYVASKPPVVMSEKMHEEGQIASRARTIKEFNPEAPLFRHLSRCTYLATEMENASGWVKVEDVLLEVEYDPNLEGTTNNYCEGCWQLRVYDPIPLDKVKLIEKIKT